MIEALKRSPPREHNLLWLGSLAQENSELKSRSLLYEPFQIWVKKYNPDQPRVPAGNLDGGQWTDGGGGIDGIVVGSTKRPTTSARTDAGHGRFGGSVNLPRRLDAGQTFGSESEIILAGSPTVGEPWGTWTNGRTTRFFDRSGIPIYDLDFPGHHFKEGEYHLWTNGVRGPAIRLR
ncbi:hypothetical protein FY050_16150 [Phyllobacterium endophyticum]|uniref:Uncharacterized protein n=1 Tax=Phyllobacterium endophyticum TaxID=1149773 RepID=A0A2P7B227_9HYPH|nr:hypothetical protein [Phyllobacterium endophyticum]PSH60527.1 hypothetical protein CU100_07620 [Phyllobacterium endophyticum]TYR42704.1 hypothetical protein FY050_16150 [Phyllobacterium endophyticum]